MRHLACVLRWVLLFAPALACAQKTTPEPDLQAAIWAASCMACHGTDGKAEGTGLTIGARPAAELYKLMLEYKNGQRSGTIMHQHAKGYTDQELQRIAQYFSKLKKSLP